MPDILFPMGKKHKGEPIEEVLKDYGYCMWCIEQDWFKHKYPPIYQIIVNQYGEPDKTPVHNALQARFQNLSFCTALGNLCKWRLFKKNSCIRNIDKAIIDTRKKADSLSYYSSNLEDKILELKEWKHIQNESIDNNNISLIDNEPYFKIKSIPEHQDWDIIIQTDTSNCEGDCPSFRECLINQNKIGIEIKPYLDDRYPAYLRKMKSIKFQPDYRCLVYDKFSVSNLSLEQVKQSFASSDILVFSFDEIENSKQLLLEMS